MPVVFKTVLAPPDCPVGTELLLLLSIPKAGQNFQQLPVIFCKE
jgi:hypothetical protein